MLGFTSRRLAGVVFLLVFLTLGGDADAWTPGSHKAIAAAAARLAPPDLHRQLVRNRESFLIGAVDPFRDTDPLHRVAFPDGSGELDQMIVNAVDQAIAAIRAPTPFNEVAYRLGVVSHYVAQANNPLAVARSDPQEGRYADDYLVYVESAQPRLKVIFYGFQPRFVAADLDGLVETTLARSRTLYRLVGQEYERIGYASGRTRFNDRSTAFGVASLGFSHSVSDIAEVFRYIWRAAGGIDSRSEVPLRGSEIVLLPLSPAELVDPLGERRP